ncbi:MAG TPA: SHOCT domain-containing protein [Microbacterium sp.]|uniref:SHOCT domain-containing protein n=1 Tax=Microbacterium sp. TaxID=51671 RepID=UPI002C22D165|nr:SHOCT domain-containing protein [Microbacterium sp.]HWI31245.1 SHOCT domain-containing protein [Microbacterium sp.]
MPLRRMGRPGLVGLAARTAVVAGTATAVSGGMQRRQQDKAQAQYDQDQYAAAQQQAQIDAAAQAAAAQYAPPPAPAQPAQYAAPPAPAAPAAGGADLVAELQKLAALKDAGILDDAEFAAAKAKLLG